MANLHFEVDTSPMARTVESAKVHLNGVTVAVTTMQTAVIATEQESAKIICENVDNGFYVLVKSQISQKTVAAYTEMTTKQMTLVQLVKALDNVKRQMESNFNMIASRYTKLFQSLNKALETRIKELDRQAIKLAETRKSIVFDKMKDDSSLLFSSSGEVLSVAQTAVSGKLKQKTKDALLTLSSSINEGQSYSKKIDSILLKKGHELSDDSDYHYIPAIFSSTDSLINSVDHIDNVYIAQNEVWQNIAPIVSEINRVQEDLPWTPLDDEEKLLVRREFSVLCEQQSEDERTAKEILRLFDASSWEEL